MTVINLCAGHQSAEIFILRCSKELEGRVRYRGGGREVSGVLEPSSERLIDYLQIDKLPPGEIIEFLTKLPEWQITQSIQSLPEGEGARHEAKGSNNFIQVEPPGKKPSLAFVSFRTE